MEENKKQKKESSPLINKINYLQAKYQEEIQGKSEEEKKRIQASKTYIDLHSALVMYVESNVYKILKDLGVHPKDLDANTIIENICEDLFGHTKKEAAIETFQSRNDAKFTTAYYNRIRTITTRAYDREKTRLLNQLCIHKEELEEIRKWSLRKIKGQFFVDIDDEKKKIMERIRSNPERVLTEQRYLKKRSKELSGYLDIVAEGPEIKERSTSFQKGYRWVGGSVGAYLSPIIDCEWDKMDILQDSSYRNASLLTRLVLHVAKEQAAKTLGIEIPEKSSGFLEVMMEVLEVPVIKKLADQMTDDLQLTRKKEEKRLKKEGIARNEYNSLKQKYYNKLSENYKAKVESDAIVSPKWTWKVIQKLTAEEAAWLFAWEIGACIPTVTFAWADAFKTQLEHKGSETPYEEQVAEKTAQKWPAEIRNQVLQIKEARELEYYAEKIKDIEKAYDTFLQNKMKRLLDDITAEKNMIDELRKKGKGAAGIGELQ